jgi:hypothetical protein
MAEGLPRARHFPLLTPNLSLSSRSCDYPNFIPHSVVSLELRQRKYAAGGVGDGLKALPTYRRPDRTPAPSHPGPLIKPSATRVRFPGKFMTVSLILALFVSMTVINLTFMSYWVGLERIRESGLGSADLHVVLDCVPIDNLRVVVYSGSRCDTPHSPLPLPDNFFGSHSHRAFTRRCRQLLGMIPVGAMGMRTGRVPAICVRAVGVRGPLLFVCVTVLALLLPVANAQCDGGGNGVGEVLYCCV